MNEDRSDTLFIEETERVYFSKKHKLIRYAVFAALAVLLVTVSEILSKQYVTAVLCLLLLSAAIVFAVRFLLKKLRSDCDDFEKQFYDMTDEEYEYLLSRSRGFDMMYKTFYMLDGHIWIPDRLLMIPYSEIAEARTSVERSKGLIVTGAGLYLLCRDNRRYNIRIKNFVLFSEEQAGFEKMLEKKLEKYSRARS